VHFFHVRGRKTCRGGDFRPFDAPDATGTQASGSFLAPRPAVRAKSGNDLLQACSAETSCLFYMIDYWKTLHSSDCFRGGAVDSSRIDMPGAGCRNATVLRIRPCPPPSCGGGTGRSRHRDPQPARRPPPCQKTFPVIRVVSQYLCQRPGQSELFLQARVFEAPALCYCLG